MKNKLSPKIFMELLIKAVKDKVITDEEKENIEFECAYIQYKNPSKLENKMREYLHNLKIDFE